MIWEDGRLEEETMKWLLLLLWYFCFYSCDVKSTHSIVFAYQVFSVSGYLHTTSVQHILTHFFLAKNQKIEHLQFQIRIPHGIRRSPHPFSSQSDTSFARYGHLSVEVWGKLTFGDGSTIIAKVCSFDKHLQSAAQGAPDHLWPENSYPVYCQWLH